jgi:hypothetical protein
MPFVTDQKGFAASLEKVSKQGLLKNNVNVCEFVVTTLFICKAFLLHPNAIGTERNEICTVFRKGR